MGAYQLWFERTVSQATPVRLFMQTSWGWPAIESVHFLGLTLLFGSIVVWDLRLLGMAGGVPISAFHRLVPFAVLGFAINIVSGSMFVMAEANQYVYNPAFQFKLLFLALAGVNVLVFYVTMFRRVAALGPGAAAPRGVRVSGALSLVFWAAVIICGRLITFYRPTVCTPGRAIGFIADCIIR
ncbi:MAG TPA: hypothetical protein VIK60_03705 [Vicinamibacterales bacterium]